MVALNDIELTGHEQIEVFGAREHNLKNIDVAIPRNPATILYDGRDKLGATKVVAIAKSAWATSPGTVLADAIEIVDTTRWGTAYKIPIGQNLSSSSMFEYASLLVMASADGTVVQIDKDGNGTVDITQTLNQGQSYQVNGGINSNASVGSSHLLTFMMFTPSLVRVLGS